MSRLSRAHIFEEYEPSVGYPGVWFYDTEGDTSASGGTTSYQSNDPADYNEHESTSDGYMDANGNLIETSGTNTTNETSSRDPEGNRDTGSTVRTNSGSGDGDGDGDGDENPFDDELADFGEDVDATNEVLAALSGQVQGTVDDTLSDNQQDIADILTQLGIDSSTMTAGNVSALQGLMGPGGPLAGLTGAQGNIEGIAGQLRGMSGQAGQGFFNASGRVGGIANMLEGVGRGGIDPRFQQLADIRRDALRDSQQEQQTRQGNFFARRGLGGSSASLNAQNKLSSQFGKQEQDLQAQLGLAGLQRSDQALLQSAGLQGQSAGLSGQGFGLQSGLLGQAAGAYGTAGNMAAQNTGIQSGLLGQILGAQQNDVTNRGNVASGLAGLNSQAFNQNLGAGEFWNSGLEQQGNFSTTQLQNSMAPLSLMIANLAAQNAGETGSSGGGGKK